MFILNNQETHQFEKVSERDKQTSQQEKSLGI